jgi:hypothetical protein
MSSPTTDEDESGDLLREELDERSADVVEDGEFVPFDEHDANRD